jgi:TPP-dependent pyruvate/acetoin dehydrogenase alpha subunit
MNHGHTRESLIAFEQRIVHRFEAGELPFLVHFCGGNEDELLGIFREVKEGDWIFASHRCHYEALLAGIPAEKVERLICEGSSMFIFDRERRFVSSSILAGTCAMAAGVAHAIAERGGSERVFCFLGDGAEDNGHFAEAVRFVTARDLPCTFVIADNDRQVDTSYAERWGSHDRMLWGPKVRRYAYTPTFPHAGRGPGPMVTFKPDIVAKHALIKAP